MEIKKFVTEENLDELFDMQEEGCSNDCKERTYIDWSDGGKVKWIRSSRTTTLF